MVLMPRYAVAMVAMFSGSAVGCAATSDSGDSATATSEQTSCLNGDMGCGPIATTPIELMSAFGDTLFGLHGSQVIAIPMAGAPSSVLATLPGKKVGRGAGIAADAERVYVLRFVETDRGVPYQKIQVQAVSRATGEISVVSERPIEDPPTRKDVLPIAVDKETLYWAECNYGGGAPRGAIKSLALSTPNAEPVVLATEECPNAIAIEGDHLYFAAYPGRGLARVPIAGGEVQVLTDVGRRRATGIAVDGDTVYWMDDTGFGNQGLFATPAEGGATTELSGTGADEVVVRGKVAHWRGPFGFARSREAGDFARRTNVVRASETLLTGLVTSDFYFWSTSKGVFKRPHVPMP